MTWVRLDDGFTDHPKISKIGPLGIALHVAALCYCNRNLTDGLIPRAVVNRLIDLTYEHIDGMGLAAIICEAGVWEEDDEGDFRIHDFFDYQPSKVQVEHERELTRKRVAAFRSRSNAVTNGVSNADVTLPPVPVPKDQNHLPTSVDVQKVFDYWVAARKKSSRVKLTGDRISKIRARLREYSVQELERAIDGIALDPWVERPKNDDIGTICRDAQHVDRFLAFMENGNGNGSGPMMAANHHVWGHTPSA